MESTEEVSRDQSAFLEILYLEKSILDVLLANAELNDTKRMFAGIRKPSKLTRDLMQDLVRNYEKRAEANKKVIT